MRLLLAELAPRRGEVEANLERLVRVVREHPCDLAVFPELFLTGYVIGQRFHEVAEALDGRCATELRQLARSTDTAVVVGTATRSSERRGEVHNAAVLVRPDGTAVAQLKRYLPTYGPFEEGSHFTPTDRSAPVPLGEHLLGLQICYDAFFPEISRELGLAGVDLLVVISAAPTTSSRLFAKVLPARAVENTVPLVYVNRVGVEDGIVFGGGSVLFDARGEPADLTEVTRSGLDPAEHLFSAEIDLTEARRWRPFRPTLRDVAARPATREPSAERLP